MSLTYPTLYSAVATGLIKGRMGFLTKLNDAFDIPAGAAAGVLYVNMLDTVVTETPTAGTFLAQGVANTLTAITLTHKFATNLMSVNQTMGAMQTPQAHGAILEKFADALVMDMQAAVIAGLKAATISPNTDTLTTTFIDFAIPSSSTTTAAMVLEYMQPVSKAITTVMANKAGAPLSQFYVLTTPTALGNLMGLGYVQGISSPITVRPDGTAFIAPGIDVFGIDGTNFGSAGNEVMFVGHREGYAFKFDGIRPWRGGVPVEDGDGQLRQSYYAAYGYGVPKDELLFEIVNPKS